MFHRGTMIGWLTLVVAFNVATAAAFAQPTSEGGPLRGEDSPMAGLPAPELDDVGVEEKRGDSLPLDLLFKNEHGEDVRLGDYFESGKPVILNLAYYECPMLCGLVFQGMTQTAGRLAWTPGREYEIVTVSIEPNDTPQIAADRKKTTMLYVDRPGAEEGWHFLTGNQQAIDELTQAIGWRYTYLHERQEFAHPAVIMIITPEGTISRYLYGVQFDHNTTRLSLVEAADGKVGSATDLFLLFCFHFDEETGAYTASIMNLMRLSGGLTVVLIISGIALLVFRERWKQRTPTNRPTPAMT